MRMTRIALLGALCLLASGVGCSKEKNLDTFAKCLASKGATMYGAYWCPHCKDQKDEFGDAFKYINYVECSIPGKPTTIQTDACKAKQITRYPTWHFSDGARIEAVESMQQLAEKTGCEAPPVK